MGCTFRTDASSCGRPSTLWAGADSAVAPRHQRLAKNWKCSAGSTSLSEASTIPVGPISNNSNVTSCSSCCTRSGITCVPNSTAGESVASCPAQEEEFADAYARRNYTNDFTSLDAAAGGWRHITRQCSGPSQWVSFLWFESRRRPLYPSPMLLRSRSGIPGLRSMRFAYSPSMLAMSSRGKGVTLLTQHPVGERGSLLLTQHSTTNEPPSFAFIQHDRPRIPAPRIAPTFWYALRCEKISHGAKTIRRFSAANEVHAQCVAPRRSNR